MNAIRRLKNLPNYVQFLCLLAVFFLLALQSAYAETKDFPLNKLAADQEFAGIAEVDRKADKWLADAKSIAATKGKSTSVENELIKIINNALKDGVVSYISPDGRVRITDGHHKVTAAEKLMAEYHIPQSAVRFRAEVEKDFRKKNWRQYVKWREENNPAYMPEGLREKLSFAEKVEFYKKLPTNFSELKDSPMRSAMGFFFDSIDVKGSYFDPFIQFELGEKVAKLGLKVEPGKEFSTEVQTKIKNAVFTGPDSDDLQKFLLEKANPAKRLEVEASFRTAKALTLSEQNFSDATGGQAGAAGFQAGSANACEKGFAFLLPKEKKEFSELLLAAKNSYAQKVDMDRLGDILKQLKNGEKISDKDILFLKEARKNALTLRSTIKLLGSEEDKKASQEFRAFVRDLGDLNDKIVGWGGKGKLPASISDSASGLREALKKDLLKNNFTMKSPAEFAKYNQEYLQWLKNTSTSNALTVEQYHNIRKAVRDYKILLELMVEKTPTKESVQLLRRLTALSKRMGKVKDGLLVPTESGVSVKLLQRKTKIDDDSKKDLADFLALMKPQLGQ